MFRRFVSLLMFVTWLSAASRAGGPAFVAGSAFDPLIKGQPVVWANGSLQYFTDQGNLSPILSNTQADSFVAAAFTPWTSISGAALSVAQAGHLAEDVSSANVSCDIQGNCTMPADIAPNATGTPVGIVYDYDGAVTDALLGQGAGGSDYCFTNAVYGGPDNFGSQGTIVHALVVMNGVCAATSGQLPDVQYRLERTLGRVLGLGWSQANVNVQSGKPRPGTDDYEGFPLMHYVDAHACVPIASCYGVDAAVPKMDDRAALRRLYPAQGSPQTVRIYGNVYFTDPSGNPLQPMQGVNVAARWIDNHGQPSRRYVATSVSGFAFRGNAGNIINGNTDNNGLRYDQFGSDDPALEGFFDLADLEIPDGSQSAQFQLSVEAVDPLWSLGVGPYAPPVDPNWYDGIAPFTPSQVAPSGQFAPVIVTVQAGGEVQQDILMQGSEQVQPHPGAGSTYANPASLPLSGSWGSWISGYGTTDFFQFTAQAYRTASVTVTALDESGQPAENKVMPVIGIWELSDLSGNPAPAATPVAFNTLQTGVTRLDAQFGASEAFRLGVADFRGDGRPDYHYLASLLYSDSVSPARIGLQGGPVTLTGIGFHPGLQVRVGNTAASVLGISATQIDAAIPPGIQDGSVTLTVTDPASGGYSEMQNALTYGASATDLLLAVQMTEPSTVVGAIAANPLRVRAVAADGVTSVRGATIGWSTTNGALLSACSWATSCLALTDESGEASTLVIPKATGASIITAQLAPEVFSSPQTQQATVVATESSLDIAGQPLTQWVAQGATIYVPLTAKVLNSGVPQAGVRVNFSVVKGSATLSSFSAITDNSGNATVTAHLVNHSADVRISGCVAPNNAPCVTFTLFATASSLWTLKPVSGTEQIVTAGQYFQPLVLRVTDGTAAEDSVLGVNVVFNITVARGGQGGRGGGGDKAVEDDSNVRVILGQFQTIVASDANGFASIIPSIGDILGPCDLYILAQAGNSQLQFTLQSDSAMVGPGEPVELPVSKFSVRSGNMRSSE